MKAMLLMIAMLVLAGCSSEMSYEKQQAIWNLAAQDHVRAQLRDGDSARFEGLFLEHFGGKPVLCGWVNARNGFGGYSGAQRFIYRDAAGLVVDEGAEGDRFADGWWKYCGRRS